MKKLLLITTLITGMSFAQEMELWFECSYDYCDLYGTGNSEISVLQIAGEFWELDIYSIEPIGELADDGWIVDMNEQYILAFHPGGGSFYYPDGGPILRVYGNPGSSFYIWEAYVSDSMGDDVDAWFTNTYWQVGEPVDCAGIEDGPNEEDNCGICDDNPDNDCVQDCAGVWGGSTLVDECGVCDGEGAVYGCGCSDPDENYDCDGNCVVEIDCAGACGGDTAVDECGVCGGSGILEGACDCDGNVLDGCGVCGGEADGADCNYDGVDDVCEDEYDTGYESGLLDGFDDGATSGDLNLDGFHNVSDIVLAVELILTGQ